MMKRYFIKMMSLGMALALTVSLAGCGETADTYSEWIELVDVTDSSSPASSEEDTASENSGTTSKIPKQSQFNITKNGKSRYRIVVSLSNDGYDEGRLVQKVIKKTTDVAIPLITDNEDSNGRPEIIIGKTEREYSKTVTKSVGNNEFAIKAFSDGSIAIDGDNVTALGLAVNKFLNLYFGFDANSEKIGKEKAVPANLNIKQSALKDYKLVWNDEFNSSKLDTTKWGFQAYMAEQSNLLLYQDERVYKIKNGAMNLYADNIKDASGNPTDKYFTNTSLTTSQNMIFKYGYLEMRAKVPFGKPAHPSFWLQSSAIDAQEPLCMAEVDIFEHFATKDPYLQFGIHKWYRDGTGQHDLAKNIERYYFKSEAEAEKWHTYGYWWTPKKIYALVDGVIYGCKDISDEVGEAFSAMTSGCPVRNDGMACFRDYAYIIYNNWLVTKNTTSEKMEESEYAEPSDFKNGPITYTIDYVRLYQLPGEGGIIDVKKK